MCIHTCISTYIYTYTHTHTCKVLVYMAYMLLLGNVKTWSTMGLGVRKWCGIWWNTHIPKYTHSICCHLLRASHVPMTCVTFFLMMSLMNSDHDYTDELLIWFVLYTFTIHLVTPLRIINYWPHGTGIEILVFSIKIYINVTFNFTICGGSYAFCLLSSN
jgi:hypothetical protein